MNIILNNFNELKGQLLGNVLVNSSDPAQIADLDSIIKPMLNTHANYNSIEDLYRYYLNSNSLSENFFNKINNFYLIDYLSNKSTPTELVYKNLKCEENFKSINDLYQIISNSYLNLPTIQQRPEIVLQTNNINYSEILTKKKFRPVMILYKKRNQSKTRSESKSRFATIVSIATRLLRNYLKLLSSIKP